jgi:polysaccharide export outer membrane protein
MYNFISRATYFTICSFLILGFVMTFSSCYNSKPIAYFKTLPRDTTINSFVTKKFETKIRKDDLLGITVSSLNNELDLQFNGVNDISNEATNISQNISGYLVDENGQISLHFLGKLKVEGLTKKQLKDKLEKELLPYLKEPIVTVKYMNRKVTVMGNVVTPKVIYMNDEQMSLFDVLVDCGDLKSEALSSDLMIIRDSVEHKIIKHINLEDQSILSSEWYYVRNDDIVYVKQNPLKNDKEEKRLRVQTTVSIVTAFASVSYTHLRAHETG